MKNSMEFCRSRRVLSTNSAVNKKWLTARFVFRETFAVNENGYLRCLCFLLLTDRNFVINQNCFTALFVFLTINREKFPS